jgi:hypothetical protein
MALIDPNEIFPWIKTTPNKELVQKFVDKCRQRLQALQELPGGVRAGEYVQPTDETAPGGAQAQPMTGPGPAPLLGPSLEGLAATNRFREGAQKASVRGPGPEPQQVSVGPVSEGQQAHAREAREKTLVARGESDDKTIAFGQTGEGDEKKTEAPKKAEGPKGARRERPAPKKAVKGKPPAARAAKG